MKKVILILMFGVWIGACQTSVEDKKTEKPNPQMLLQAQNVEIAKKVYEHFNKHDWQKMAELFVENADFKDPSLGLDIVKQTRKQIVAKYQELEKAFPDLHDEIVNIYPSGDKSVIVEFISTGTAPDKSKLKVPICDIFVIENGLITKNYTYYDNPDSSSESSKK